MPIQNYPRFLTKASKTAQQSQTGLPIVGTDGTSGDFNALKVNTDGSINVAGGGGDATAFNQTVQIGEAQTSNVHLTTISQNTSVSTGSSSTIANLLEVTDGYKISQLLRKIQQYGQWNTFASVNYNCGGGGATFNLNKFSTFASRIVIHSSTVNITGLFNRATVDVTPDYFEYTTANAIANAGQEIISIGSSDNDLFSQIVVTSACHLTAYFLITPYVNP